MSNELNIDAKEQELNERLQRLEKLEADIKNKEKQMKEKEKAKKRSFGSYIVNYYQKENGISQFYIERK